MQVQQIEESGKILNPRTTEDGKVRYVGPHDWTSGFFPGTMWYMYELTNDTQWMEYAKKYTEALNSVQYLTSHHDIGFIIQCSYGNGLRLSGDSVYKDVVFLTTADYYSPQLFDNYLLYLPYALILYLPIYCSPSTIN